MIECQRKGCTNVGAWAPVIVFTEQSPAHHTYDLHMPKLLHCFTCSQSVVQEYIDHFNGLLGGAIQLPVAIDKAKTAVRWIRQSSAEWRRVSQVMARRNQ